MTPSGPKSCSSASTTPAAPRWPPAARATTPATGSRSARPAPHPPTTINPAVVDAMDEVGIDLAPAAHPRLLTDDAVEAVRRRHHHGLRRRLPRLPRQALPRLDSSTTPPAKGIDAVRSIRDDIDELVRRLITELLPTNQSTND